MMSERSGHRRRVRPRRPVLRGRRRRAGKPCACLSAVQLIKLRYSPVGNSRAERIADTAREIKAKRERNDWRLAKDQASYYGEARPADAP